METCHVVILGCGRSGTSIFGELFDYLPSYTYHSEPPFDALLAVDFATPVAVKVPKESPAFPPSPGLSFPLEHLLALIPEPRRFYWQVRHPLDTIASLRIGIAKNWGHHPRPPDWRDWLARPLLERCAHHWAYINTVGFQQVRRLVTVTRFETMLQDPAQFAHAVCAEVAADPGAHASAWAGRVQNTNNEHFVEAATSRSYSRPDHTVRVGRWRENLSAADVQCVLRILEEPARRFGYALPAPSPSDA